MQPEHKTHSFLKMIKLFGLLAAILAVSGVVFFLYHNVSKVSADKNSNQVVPQSSAHPIQTDPPLASQQINKSFDFSVNNAQGQQITSIKYVVLSAELHDQIIVKGVTASAVQGRLFLILNLKLTNDSDQDIQINTRDYLRLAVNGKDGERLAPEIYNDPVDVQAISTQFTRVGFAINTTDKNLKLYVGEISGPKTPITLNLH